MQEKDGIQRVLRALKSNKFKIVEDVDQGIQRTKDVIAPAHAKRRKRKVPCVKMGKCVDCSSSYRFCISSFGLRFCTDGI